MQCRALFGEGERAVDHADIMGRAIEQTPDALDFSDTGQKDQHIAGFRVHGPLDCRGHRRLKPVARPVGALPRRVQPPGFNRIGPPLGAQDGRVVHDRRHRLAIEGR